MKKIVCLIPASVLLLAGSARAQQVPDEIIATRDVIYEALTPRVSAIVNELAPVRDDAEYQAAERRTAELEYEIDVIQRTHDRFEALIRIHGPSLPVGQQVALEKCDEALSWGVAFHFAAVAGYRAYLRGYEDPEFWHNVDGGTQDSRLESAQSYFIRALHSYEKAGELCRVEALS